MDYLLKITVYTDTLIKIQHFHLLTQKIFHFIYPIIISFVQEQILLAQPMPCITGQPVVLKTANTKWNSQVKVIKTVIFDRYLKCQASLKLHIFMIETIGFRECVSIKWLPVACPLYWNQNIHFALIRMESNLMDEALPHMSTIFSTKSLLQTTVLKYTVWAHLENRSIVMSYLYPMMRCQAGALLSHHYNDYHVTWVSWHIKSPAIV